MYQTCARFGLALACLWGGCVSGAADEVWVSIPMADRNVVADALGIAPQSEVVPYRGLGLGLMAVPADRLGEIATVLHDKNHHCGGFVAFDSLDEARGQATGEVAAVQMQPDYELSHAAIVEPLVELVEADRILAGINKLSSFPTRYYNTNGGKQSAEWLKEEWQGYAEGRPDTMVEFWDHGWKQPSVILTILGSEDPGEVVVVGGHLDSTTGFFSGGSAPGADDDASGIATIGEAARILLQNGIRPKRTLKFMAYAGEEAGLLGSKAIANKFADDGIPVLGVLQLDMVGFKGSDVDIAFNESHTDAAQNEFLKELVDTYLPSLTWGTLACGYACSDHASWDDRGFPASNPFEAFFDDHNSAIHSSSDTVATMGGDADHAAKFAKLTLAYVVELAGATVFQAPPGPLPPKNQGPLPPGL